MNKNKKEELFLFLTLFIFFGLGQVTAYILDINNLNWFHYVNLFIISIYSWLVVVFVRMSNKEEKEDE